jgi:hypothetical protein
MTAVMIDATIVRTGAMTGATAAERRGEYAVHK